MKFHPAHQPPRPNRSSFAPGQPRGPFGSFPPHLAPLLKSLLEAETKTPDGPVPDWSTRLNALKLAMAYEVGLPTQRKEQPKKRVKTNSEIMNSIVGNDAYRARLREILDTAEAQAAQNQSPGLPEQGGRSLNGSN